MDEALFDFIGEIYAASYNPQNWDAVLARLCELTGAKSGGIFVDDRELCTRRIAAQHGLPALADPFYRAGLGKYDYVFQAQEKQEPGIARQIVDHREIKQAHPLYYRLLLKPNNVGFVCGISIFNDKEWHVGIGLHRSFDAVPFGEQEINLLNLLYPHFARAMRIQRELSRLRSREKLLQSTLSRLLLGVMILGRDMALQFCNPVADALLKQHRGLEVREGRVRAHNDEDNQRLIEMIATLSNRGHQAVTTECLALGMRHPGREFPLMVMVASLTDNREYFVPEKEEGAVALYISDPQSQNNVPAEILKSLYGLTRAEAKVAISLTNGLTLQQIAEQNCVEIGTVRSQLKSIFAKMGVNKQQDVVRVLLSGALGIR